MSYERLTHYRVALDYKHEYAEPNDGVENGDIYNRLAELEDKLESGLLVELPKEKWIITRGQTIAGYNYCIHEIPPTAKYYNGEWHFDWHFSEAAQWRAFVKEFDTKEAAEEELKELRIMNGEYLQ